MLKSCGIVILSVLFFCLSASQGFAVDYSNAKKLFKHHCAECHGENGDGNSPMSKHVHPVPSNFISHNYVDSEGKHVSQYSIHELRNIIMFGRRGTTMIGFGEKLSEADMEDLANYIKSLNENAKD